eukprot:s1482_g11.t1
MGLADGTLLSNLPHFGVDSVKALSWWRGLQSPMTFVSTFGLLCTLVLVTYMIPRHAHESEPDPEQPEGSEHAESPDHAGGTGEPATEPQPSRYPMDERSLGCKFPAVFSDAMFRYEEVSDPGELIAIHHTGEMEDSDEESSEVRRRRYLVSKRYEVSDGKQWDVWFQECLDENEQINNETFSETKRDLMQKRGMREMSTLEVHPLKVNQIFQGLFSDSAGSQPDLSGKA